MKVRLRKPANWFGPYQFADKFIAPWLGEERAGEIAEKLPSDLPNAIYNWWNKTKDNKVSYVKIEPHDLWNVDNTLNRIILPLIKAFRDMEGNSYGIIDIDDAPAYLHPNCFKPLTEGEIRCSYPEPGSHERYRWFLDELVFTFEALNSDVHSWFESADFEIRHIDTPVDPVTKTRLWKSERIGTFDEVGYRQTQARIQNGLRLFGKYYRTLWD